MSRRWVDVAELVATQGLKGRFVARSADGLPFLLDEGMQVHFVPPTLNGPRIAKVGEVSYMGDDEYLIAFEGIRTLDVAEELVGSHCIVARADVQDVDEEGLPASWALAGFRVVDEHAGEVGEIVEVQEMPTQDLLVVEAASGAEVLVPLVEEFLVDVDAEAGVLYMDLPAGLIDEEQAENVD